MTAAESPVGGPWPWAPASLTLALALAGAALTVLVVWSPALLTSYGPPPPTAVRVLLASSAGAVVLASALSGPRVRHSHLLVSGMIALGALAVLVLVPDPVALGALILLLGGLHATLPSRRSFALRMRGPATAAVLIGTAWLCLHTTSVGAHRAAALALGLAIAAAAGLVPYLQDLDPDEPTGSSSVVWAGFLALRRRDVGRQPHWSRTVQCRSLRNAGAREQDALI